MKKSNSIILFLFIISHVFAQTNAQRASIRKSLSDISLKAKKPVETSQNIEKKLSKQGSETSLFIRDDIGETRWDDQSNASLQNRLYYYPDGSIGATWSMGFNDAGYPDRGTGYNYFDGTSWGAYPTIAIENERSGWPSYQAFGDGEIIASHTSNSGIRISTRNVKGSGTWNASTLAGPTGHESLLWPRMVTSGPNKQDIHIFGLTRSTGYSGTPYHGIDGALLYYRSEDGGVSWNIRDSILPGMTAADYTGFSSDAYAFAEPAGDTLAFIVGDTWHDLFLMKSVDGGDHWTKTTLFQHPYPLFDETKTIVSDTPWVCDGAMAVALDKDGMAHVTFGLMRVLNEDTLDGETSYFPFTDGLAYWNESMPTFSNLNIDSVDARGNLVAWVIDLSENDTLDFLPGGSEIIGLYFVALSSMPSMMIDKESGEVFISYASINELRNDNTQHFRHIFGVRTINGEWSCPPVLITGSIVYNWVECVYPTLSPTDDMNHVHMIFQGDDFPGLSSWGDEDPPDDNTIIYAKVEKEEFLCNVGIDDPILSATVSVFPNPGSSELNITFSEGISGKADFSFLDISGRICKSGTFNNISTGENIKLDIRDLSPGLYIYTISLPKGKISGKFIKQQ